MIAYNVDWLFNLYAREQADEALGRDCITPGEREKIYESSPIGFYTPNIWGMIGTALLTLLATCLGFGYLGLLMGAFDSPAISLTFAGFALYAALRLLIIGRLQHYNSGSDNVLILLASASFVFGISAFFHTYDDPHYTLVAFCSLIVCSFMAVHFADAFMSVLAAISWAMFVFLAWSQLGGVAEATAPFLAMAAAYLLYLLSTKAVEDYRLVLYSKCLRCVATTSLVLLYAAGNYYVVQWLGSGMMTEYSGMRRQLTMGWLFWLLTMTIPFVYIAAGVRGKNVMLIRTGLLLLAASVFTYRLYYSVLSPDKAMIIGGVVLALAGFQLSRYLRVPRHGFTSTPDVHKPRRSEISELLTDHIVDKATQGGNRDAHDNSW